MHGDAAAEAIACVLNKTNNLKKTCVLPIMIS